MVSATCELKIKYAMNPQNAAHATAFNGDNTLVVMIHETASAASFMPFKKVINNANINEAATMNANISRILNDDSSYCIGYILQNVARTLKSLRDVLVLHHLYIVGVAVEHIADIIEIDAVYDMLYVLYLVAMFYDFIAV